MSKYRVKKGPKPYKLSDGDVVLAQPRKVLIISDELDKSTSIIIACKNKELIKIEEKVEIPASPMVKNIEEKPKKEILKKALKKEDLKEVPDKEEKFEDEVEEKASEENKKSKKNKWR